LRAARNRSKADVTLASPGFRVCARSRTGRAAASQFAIQSFLLDWQFNEAENAEERKAAYVTILPQENNDFRWFELRLTIFVFVGMYFPGPVTG